MWNFDDAPRLSVEMDSMRPNYAGFDAGSLDSVQWSRRAPARVLRRRCRSEGVDRSPYEEASRDLHSYLESTRPSIPPPKGYTNGYECLDRYHECASAENGAYIMANDNGYSGYKQGKSKYYRASPTRPLITTLSNTKVDDRLPKVEELLEKVDQEMLEVSSIKQPLKSILNNPLPKSPPHGILKKPKSKPYYESRIIEGRRRQRASSEPDNAYCNYHLSAPLSYDRNYYHTNNTKRGKDNSGGYLYGNTPYNSPQAKLNYVNNTRCSCKDQVIIDEYKMHVLRTTAINNDTSNDIPVIVESKSGYYSLDTQKSESKTKSSSKFQSPHKDSHPVRPINSGLAQTKPKPKKKPKPKVKVMKTVNQSVIDGEIDDYNSRSPSPDVDSWQMDTETDIHTDTSDKPRTDCVNKITTKLNGTIVSPKKNIQKGKINSDKDLIEAMHYISLHKSGPTTKDTLPDSIASCTRPSLFPRVPPYLKFVRHDETSPLKIPPAIQKHLKWKLTTITPIVVKKTLTNSGFRLIKSECDTAECPQEETLDWIGIWGKHMKSLMFRAIKEGQKMNHFPGTFQIGRKDRLWRNLQKLSAKYGVSEFGIMPKTYVLPHDMKILKHEWEKHVANDERWIIKPPASARGTGIKVVSRWAQIPKKRPVVVQRYVSRPYLINGSKFDLRLYVLVTSVHPLRIYLYHDGLARFASVKYNDELSSLNDRYMHLTNYSINRLSKNYTPNEDFAACEGHKWTLDTLFQYLKTEKAVDTEALWESIKDLVIKTIISGEGSISALTKANVGSRYNCYELFGIDVLLDEDLKPWLLEVNISPSLHSASPLDIHVKGPLVSTVLNLAQFHVPARTNLDALQPGHDCKLDGLPYDSRLYTVYLSKEERDKHLIYTNIEDRQTYLREILNTLTSDDVRSLICAEDELRVCDGMERIFPTANTHRYLTYLAGPRYYNRLFDAWETRYSGDRHAGISLLQRLCATGYHLEAPPVPLKNDVDAPTPPASTRPSASDVPEADSTATANAAATTASAAATANAAAALRVCGPLAPPPLALEPRA
ncbi:tubulin polyglutamylase ttll-4-like isoform X3 [Aricia agestis]|uniref:tubulin polyglutamylase ttll-4-like isoform X3 n=1 Tax=Aricia agestis TaxID=91739 RepID=UPI001C202DBB|nr:tubulin polyglutamylase ttll-4-like isoform X3 [Aricia agestis]